MKKIINSLFIISALVIVGCTSSKEKSSSVAEESSSVSSQTTNSTTKSSTAATSSSSSKVVNDNQMKIMPTEIALQNDEQSIFDENIGKFVYWYSQEAEWGLGIKVNKPTIKIEGNTLTYTFSTVDNITAGGFYAAQLFYQSPFSEMANGENVRGYAASFKVKASVNATITLNGVLYSLRKDVVETLDFVTGAEGVWDYDKYTPNPSISIQFGEVTGDFGEGIVYPGTYVFSDFYIAEQ